MIDFEELNAELERHNLRLEYIKTMNGVILEFTRLNGNVIAVAKGPSLEYSFGVILGKLADTKEFRLIRETGLSYL